MDKLKPCPFCGELPVLRQSKLPAKMNSKGLYLCCENMNCGMVVETGYCNSYEEAVAQWNNRKG